MEGGVEQKRGHSCSKQAGQPHVWQQVPVVGRGGGGCLVKFSSSGFSFLSEEGSWVIH